MTFSKISSLVLILTFTQVVSAADLVATYQCGDQMILKIRYEYAGAQWPSAAGTFSLTGAGKYDGTYSGLGDGYCYEQKKANSQTACLDHDLEYIKNSGKISLGSDMAPEINCQRLTNSRGVAE